MKQVLILFSVIVAVHAWAQTYPTQRVHYGDQVADIQPTVMNNRQASIDIKNPYGNENVTVEFKEGENGKVSMIAKDKNTGRILSTTEGIENQYVNSSSEIHGVKKDLHLRVDGNDVEGTVGYSDQNKGEELFANVMGNGMGSFNQTKQGYQMVVNVRGDDSAMVTYSNAETREVICIIDDNNGIVRVYDGNKKLIAEGESEEDDPSKIYNQAAWEKCVKVIDIFDDEEDD